MSGRSRCGGAALLLAALGIGCRSPERRSDDARQSGSSRADEPSLATLVARADSVYGRSEFDSARVLYEAAASAAERRGDSTTMAMTSTSWGLAAWHAGRFDDARTAQLRALELKRRLGLVNDEAKSLNALGMLAHDRGQSEEAFDWFAQTLRVAAGTRDSGYIAKALANRALVYMDVGDYQSARSDLMAARPLAASLGDARTETNVLNSLGKLETHVGDANQALQWLTLARARYDSLHDAVGQENVLGQQAMAYWERGEQNRAFALLDSALAIASRRGLLEPETDDLELMAQLYINAGDYRRALSYLVRARALADSLQMRTKLAHVAIAESRAFAGLGDQRTARARAAEAVEVNRAAGSRYDELDAALFGAGLAQRAGDVGASTQSLDGARALREKIGSATARIMFAIGAARVADIANRPDEVLRLLDGNRRDAALLASVEQAETDALRARALFRKNDLLSAATVGGHAVMALERIRGTLSSGPLRSSFAAERTDVYSDQVVTLLALRRVDEAFRVADAARGRGLIEHLGAAARGLREGRSTLDIVTADSLLRRIDALLSRLRAADSIRSPERAPEPSVNATARELTTARTDYEKLLDGIARREENSAILGLRSLDAASVRRSIAPDEALVEYLSASDELVIFVARHDSIQAIRVPIGRSDLAESVHLVRDLIASRDPAADVSLRALHAKLIAPVERTGLLSGVRSLLIVPHGALSYLSFAALRDATASGGRYLMERYSVVTLPSAAALPALRTRALRQVSAEVSVLAPLPRELPATRDEAQTVARRVVHSRVLDGSKATEEALRSSLALSQVVHLASHGTLNAENPMFSGVQLATPLASSVRSQNNGRLETHEVLSLDIASRLVFLSGCETGLGGAWSSSFNRGSDYTTLAQAFLFAGASNVVSTLWRIDDRGAALFAGRFYDRLADAGPAEALASAQRASARDPRYRAPYYWAAYTLSGSGRIK